MTKKELEAENDRLVNALEVMRRRLRRLGDLAQDALGDDEDDEDGNDTGDDEEE